jgi:AraC-like DNA-binding protein
MTTNSEKRLFRPDFSSPSLLSRLFADLRPSGASLARFTLRGSSAFAMDGLPYLFVALKGRCEVRGPDGAVYVMEPGAGLLALSGTELRVGPAEAVNGCASMSEVWRENAAPQTSLEGYERPVEISWGRGPIASVLLGAVMTFPRLAKTLPVFSALPPVVYLPRNECRLDRLAAPLVGTFREEQARPRDGFAVFSLAAVQILLVEMVRSYLTAQQGQLAELLDDAGERGLARVLGAFHREPERHWSLEGMASVAGMSRTRFAEAFARATGTTPFRYLTECRMRLAEHILATTDVQISEVAERAGYGSERAFREAFRRHTALSPHKYRTSRRESDRRRNLQQSPRDG